MMTDPRWWLVELDKPSFHYELSPKGDIQDPMVDMTLLDTLHN
jgi:hypothetical protein